jgi:hypothetical protein
MLEDLDRLRWACPAMAAARTDAASVEALSPPLRAAVLSLRAELFSREGKFAEASQSLKATAELAGDDAQAWYLAAAAAARCARAAGIDAATAGGRPAGRDELAGLAIDALAKALELGYSDAHRLLFDSDLDSVRTHAGFAGLIERATHGQ